MGSRPKQNLRGAKRSVEGPNKQLRGTNYTRLSSPPTCECQVPESAERLSRSHISWAVHTYCIVSRWIATLAIVPGRLELKIRTKRKERVWRRLSQRLSQQCSHAVTLPRYLHRSTSRTILETPRIPVEKISPLKQCTSNLQSDLATVLYFPQIHNKPPAPLYLAETSLRLIEL